MINYLNEEPLIKRIIISVILVMTLAYGIFFLFQMKQLDSIYKNQINTFQRIAGAILKQYPEEEIQVLEAIFNENDENQRLGAEVMSRYGYDLELEMFNDSTFIDYRESLLKSNSLMMVGILLFNIIILCLSFRKIIFHFKQISEILGSFMKGEYKVKDIKIKRGLIGRVLNQLRQVGNSVELKQEMIKDEKKNTQELVTDISHQLKTPLASLDMCYSILLDSELTPLERKEFLESGGKSIKKLEALIDVLLNISRLEADMIRIKPEYNSIKETLAKAVSSVYMKALNKDIDIELIEFIDQKIPHDSKWTEEAIANVLENGIKYTNAGGQIKISVTENINFVRISVKDNGIGISKGEFNKVFKRFYRGERREVKELEGSGVGLYLTRRILEEQGGSIMVNSKIEEGSEFCILLRKN